VHLSVYMSDCIVSVGGCGVDYCGSGQGPMSSYFEDGNEPCGLYNIEGKDFMIILRPQKEVQRPMQMRRPSFCVLLHCRPGVMYVIEPKVLVVGEDLCEQTG
jgi:hypothetical protein